MAGRIRFSVEIFAAAPRIRSFRGSAGASTVGPVDAVARSSYAICIFPTWRSSNHDQRHTPYGPKQVPQIDRLNTAASRLPTFVLLHGQQDMIVPLEQSSTFHKAFVKALPDAPRCILKARS